MTLTNTNNIKIIPHVVITDPALIKKFAEICSSLNLFSLLSVI